LQLASTPRATDAAAINASCAECPWECVMIKKVASIILAVGCAGLIIAFIPPLASVEEAFATARGSHAEIAPPSQPQAQRSCEDLEFWFLNSGCAKARTKHVARAKHHVATSHVAVHAGAADGTSVKR
jgi:hypothetical protein